MAFSTKIKGHHHLQGNVQVYNVRIPVLVRIPFIPGRVRRRSRFAGGGDVVPRTRLPYPHQQPSRGQAKVVTDEEGN